ncbi:MAG: hypothetical protein WC878_06490 [Candidatus Paceibacterota bacterium]|jgi:hypothetical protein
METQPQETKKEYNVFPHVREQMEAKLFELRENKKESGHFAYGGTEREIREGNKQDEMTAEAQMKVRAAETVLHEAEEALKSFSSSREMYLRTIIAAKFLAVYQEMEKVCALAAEAGSKKAEDPNYAGMEKLILEEIEKFSHLLK